MEVIMDRPLLDTLHPQWMVAILSKEQLMIHLLSTYLTAMAQLTLILLLSSTQTPTKIQTFTSPKLLLLKAQ